METGSPEDTGAAQKTGKGDGTQGYGRTRKQKGGRVNLDKPGADRNDLQGPVFLSEKQQGRFSGIMEFNLPFYNHVPQDILDDALLVPRAAL